MKMIPHTMNFRPVVLTGPAAFDEEAVLLAAEEVLEVVIAEDEEEGLEVVPSGYIMLIVEELG